MKIKSHGGQRKGAGRPKENNTVAAMIRCYPSDWRTFCRLRDSHSLSSADYFRSLFIGKKSETENKT